MIYSIQVERHVLSGLIKYQNLFAEVDIFLNDTDFFNEVHSTIYSVYKSIAHKGEKVDKVLLAEKIKNIPQDIWYLCNLFIIFNTYSQFFLLFLVF